MLKIPAFGNTQSVVYNYEKNLLILIIRLLFVNCADKTPEPKIESQESAEIVENTNKPNLEYIDRWNQIELAHTDDKYGEWGGDTDIILIYSDGKKYYANYAKYLGSYEPLNPPSENEEIKNWYE